MTEMGPEGGHDQVEFAKDAMARDLMDVYGVSFDKAKTYVEELHARVRHEKEASQQATKQEEENNNG